MLFQPRARRDDHTRASRMSGFTSALVALPTTQSHLVKNEGPMPGSFAAPAARSYAPA